MRSQPGEPRGTRGLAAILNASEVFGGLGKFRRNVRCVWQLFIMVQTRTVLRTIERDEATNGDCAGAARDVPARREAVYSQQLTGVTRAPGTTAFL